MNLNGLPNVLHVNACHKGACTNAAQHCKSSQYCYLGNVEAAITVLSSDGLVHTHRCDQAYTHFLHSMGRPMQKQHRSEFPDSFLKMCHASCRYMEVRLRMNGTTVR